MAEQIEASSAGSTESSSYRCGSPKYDRNSSSLPCIAIMKQTPSRSSTAPAQPSPSTYRQTGRPGFDAARVRLFLRGIKKKLHPAFREQDLRNAMTILIVEHPRPARPEIGKPHRNVEVLKLEFHEKIIAEIDRIGAERIELRPTCGVRDDENLLRGLRPGKFMQPLDEERRSPIPASTSIASAVARIAGWRAVLFQLRFATLDQGCD